MIFGISGTKRTVRNRGVSVFLAVMNLKATFLSSILIAIEDQW